MKISNLGTRIANNFIFPIKSGYVLIDTGHENHFSSFCKELRKKNISLGDIVYVFLTHAHDDHAGFLNELMKHSRAKIIMSEKAAEGLRRGHNSCCYEWLPKFKSCNYLDRRCGTILSFLGKDDSVTS